MSSDGSSTTVATSAVGVRHSTKGPHEILGTLHVLFGSVLVFIGLYSVVTVALQVAAAPMMEGYQSLIMDGMREQHDGPIREEIAEVTEQEEAAETDEQRAKLEARRIDLEEQLNEPLPAINVNIFASDRRYALFLITDAVTGLILNGVMVIVGIGLLASKEWARRLGLWVAWLKIFRLITIYGVAIAVIIPAFAKEMGDMIRDMAPLQPAGGPPMPDMANSMTMFYAIALSAMAVLMILFGVIYPIVSLRVLTRPKVKFACAPQPSTSSAGPA